jgi:UDP-N-acetylglucosamine acyltransferase
VGGRRVHPSAHLGPEVDLAEDVEVGPGAVMNGRVRVGRGARIGALCVVGGDPKVRGHGASVGEVVIESGAVLSEHCAVDAPTGATTRVGADAYLLPHCYVGHDSYLGRGVTLTAGVLLGGHVWIGDGATLGLGVRVHQFSAIGERAMLGMGTVVCRDVPPYALATGSPVRVRGCNRVGLERAGLAGEIDSVTAWLVSGVEPPAGPFAAALQRWRTASRRRVATSETGPGEARAA